MDSKTESKLAMLMGVIIAIADLYWTYTSYYDTLWLALGVVIFIADVLWMYFDYDLMTK